MTRSIVWWTTGVLALVLVLATAVWAGFDRIPSTVHTPFEPAAVRDPYLALERFMVAMGRPLTRSADASLLDRLPARGVLILTDDRIRLLTPARVEAILRWLDAGGHLVWAAAPGTDDPLLRAFTVKIVRPAVGRNARGDEPVLIRVAGRERVLGAALGTFSPLLEAGATVPAWTAANGQGVRIIHFTRGQGAATFVSSWDALTAGVRLQEADNAQVAWLLINLVNPSGAIVFLSEVHLPNLWQWLRESAWTILVAGALLILVWLSRIVPRFGPLMAENVPHRRALVEHLQAMGRAVWRRDESRALQYWMYCVRRGVLARAAARDPGLLQQSPLDQARALAERVAGRGGLDASRVRAALAGSASALEGPVAREGFTQAIAVLQAIEEQL